jgi:outer membrane receptor protein involved in Fe transport
VTRRHAPLPLALLLSATPTLAARPVAIDLPAGSLGAAVVALGHQAHVDVVVDDAALWTRPVAALRGRYAPADALKRLLARTGARAIPVGPASWRIRPAPMPSPRPHRAEPTAAPPPPPAAADAAAIVVTASKRDLRLRDFPGTVTILDGLDLTFGGPGGTDAILSRLASVSSTYLGAGRNKLFIRGIADSSFTGPTQATVGQYLGDLRLTYNAPDPDLRLYDISSVEVLEGPQGTLYGAGSLGGIIRTVPNVPALDTTSGSLAMGVSATEHGAPGGDISAMANLPVITDTVGLRLVGYGESDGGYIDNPLRQKDNINRTNIAGGRATLRVSPGGGWTIDIGGIYQRNHGDDSQYADAGGPPLTRSSPVAEGFNADYKLGEMVISKDWDGLHFRSSTGIVGQHLSERFDASPIGAPAEVFTQRNATRLITTEARLWRPMQNGFGWVIGASYIDNRTILDRALGPPGATLPVTGVDNSIHEATLYGEASLRLLPWLTATAGGRASFARLSGGGNDVVPAASIIEALARAQVIADRKATSLLPSFALTASPLDRLTLYMRYQQGFRPGGLAIQSGFVQRFHSDRVETVEGGLRYGRPGPHGWDISASLSGTRWDNIQADFIDASGLPSTANIGNGRILSLAASASWRPLASLRLDAALAFNDSKVTEPSETYQALLIVAAASGSSDAMRRIPNIARVTGRAGFDWQRPLGDGLALRVYGWARYVGRSRLGVGPFLGEEQGDYTDSALTARIGTPGLGASLTLTNLADSIGNRFALGTPFAIGREQITPLRPRTIRIGLDAKF